MLNVYERLSANLHSYSRLTQPNPTQLNKTQYTSQGYAVFFPDIAYKINDPGMSAVWCIVPAVKAAIATGMVDPKRVGIMGHSWGGYETAFLDRSTSRTGTRCGRSWPHGDLYTTLAIMSRTS